MTVKHIEFKIQIELIYRFFTKINPKNMNFLLAFNFSTNVLKNISDSINCRNRNTVNMQLLSLTINKRENVKTKAINKTKNESDKICVMKMNLTIIGSSFNIGTQSFVLATREMVALKNCFLSENGSSS
jgi:hypothetical protein